MPLISGIIKRSIRFIRNKYKTVLEPSENRHSEPSENRHSEPSENRQSELKEKRQQPRCGFVLVCGVRG